MKAWLVRILLLGVLIASGFWGWRMLSPGPERVIRNRLQELSRSVTFSSSESQLAKLAHAQKLSAFFANDVEVTVDAPGRAQQTFTGRDEILQAALAAASMAGRLNVEFLDINVTLGPDKTSAVANLTAKGTIGGEKDNLVQEMKFTLRKGESGWLINRVETVKTLL